MLIIVRVDNEYPNQTAIAAASCAWPCGRMLDSADHRNNHKLVVPYTREHGFLDVFCIKSLYEQLPKESRVRRVCFDLVPVSKNCKQTVLSALNDWLGDGPLRVQSVNYIDRGELAQFSQEINDLNCCKEEPMLKAMEQA